MTKPTDKVRILRLLLKEGGQLSSPRVKARLGLSDERYDKVRTELINDGLVERTTGRGGGLRLTPNGLEEATSQKKDESTEIGQDVWRGTGFFVSGKGHVLTNFHVIDGANNRIRISLSGTQPTWARVVAQDETNDLALLETALRPKTLPIFRERVGVGEHIAVYGFPISEVFGPMGSFTDGIVNATAGLQENTAILQISARALPGNSGGPVLDQGGNVVGVVEGGINFLKFFEDYEEVPTNVNYAIKGEVALSFLKTNGVHPKSTANKTTLRSWDDAVVRGKSFTVFIECNVPDEDMPAEKITKSGFWGRLRTILAGR